MSIAGQIIISCIIGVYIGWSLWVQVKQSKTIRKLRANADENYKKYLEKKYEFFKNQIEDSVEREKKVRDESLKLIAEEYERRCQKIAEDYKELFLREEKTYNEEISEIKKTLDDFRTRRASINSAIQREREIEEKVDFYRVQVSQDDRDDIELLESMSPRLRHKELIPKLIWDSIISRPANEMIKRVVGDKAGGIYKITYIPTGESYIGRTVNFKDRWKSHIQTALGLEKIASSTLHTHMARNGIWNYTFEILEEVSKEKQSEREKFYIDLYGTKAQLNMRAGG